MASKTAGMKKASALADADLVLDTRDCTENTPCERTDCTMGKHWAKHMVERYGVTGYTCDACGKSVNGEPDDWTEIESWHDDWDNDSVESHHDQVACSAQCLGALLEGEVSGYSVQGEPTLRVKIGMMDYGTAKALAALIDPSRRNDHGE